MRSRFPGKLRHPLRLEIDHGSSPGATGETTPDWRVAIQLLFGALEPLGTRDQLTAGKEIYGISARLTIRDQPIELPPGRVRFVSLEDGRVWYPGTIPPPTADGYIEMMVSEVQL